MRNKKYINKVICGDNLKVMRQISDNSIDLIYCDILYGTGKDFGDYKDIKADKEVVKKFYIPRIKEMHRILKETGSIYLQMDYRINHWIRLILDDTFGFNNLVNEIIWCYRGGGIKKDRFSCKHETIYWYSKSKKHIYNIQFIPYTTSNPGYRHGTSDIRRGKHLEDWWMDIQVRGNCPTKKEWVKYSSQKPLKLLERIIKASSNKEDIIADFFCGSGTTGVVAKELGRNFILCDISERACKIARKRIKEI